MGTVVDFVSRLSSAGATDRKQGSECTSWKEKKGVRFTSSEKGVRFTSQYARWRISSCFDTPAPSDNLVARLASQPRTHDGSGAALIEGSEMKLTLLRLAAQQVPL